MKVEKVDVVVIGAGPAGLAAAEVTGSLGAKTVVVDENSQPGGQLFKQIHKFFGSSNHYAGTRGFNIARELIARVKEGNVDLRLDTVCWDLNEQKQVMLADKERTFQLQAKAVILATGANEKSIVFPGWTLPGVMTAGAAQTLTNIHGVLPGKKVLIIGSGNVGLIVGYQLLQGGAHIVALVEAAPTTGGYDVHVAKLARKGVPILTSHTILEARGKGRVEEAVIAQVDQNWQPIAGTEKTLEVDTILLAVGLNPMVELASMAGCQVVYSPALGGYVPLHDENMATTVPGIFVAGDLAGVEEASSAMEEGHLAGWSAAKSLGLTGGPEAERRFFVEARQNLEDLRSAPLSRKIWEGKKKLWAQMGSAAEENVVEYTYVSGKPCGKSIPDRLPVSDRPVAVVECWQNIPCDPCTAACPRQAITIEDHLIGTPKLDVDKCNGCGICMTKCPGLAIFLVDGSLPGEEGRLTLPYEYRPLPQVEETVITLDRQGQPVGQGRVIRVRQSEKFDRTVLVTLQLPKEHLMLVRGFKSLE
ncbi:MAG: FAD-dependent oxidoreductase [Clostridia bacterium]|nr:FAD-dependent oxidoreductase [Clostridia bacterium]